MLCLIKRKESHGKDSINWSLITAEADELFGRKSKGCRVLFFRSNDDPIRPIFNRASSDSSRVREHQRYPWISFFSIFVPIFHVPRSRIRFYPNRKIHRYRFVHFVIFFTIFSIDRILMITEMFNSMMQSGNRKEELKKGHFLKIFWFVINSCCYPSLKYHVFT